jgi:hypothetical protein
MKSIWQDESRKELNERLRALAWNNPAQWGKFTAPKMVCHLADSLRMAMGDLKVEPKRLPIRYPPLKAADHLRRAVPQGSADRAGTADARASRVGERHRRRSGIAQPRGRNGHDR